MHAGLSFGKGEERRKIKIKVGGYTTAVGRRDCLQG